MFTSLAAFLRTLILGGLLLVAGWWTLLAREKLNNGEEELHRTRQQVSALSMEVEERDREIRSLGDSLEASEARIGELVEDVAERDREIERIELAMQLLKVDSRIAKLEVLSQGATAEEPERVRTLVRFTELGPNGETVGEPQDLTVEGRKVYLETLVVKFEDAYVEEGDALRGASICLFRRVFGENEKPSQGAAIDSAGQQPMVYGGDDLPPPLHTEVWNRFWDYANDPDLASEVGIRAIHGEAPFIEARPGKTYQVELRASDGLSIRPIE